MPTFTWVPSYGSALDVEPRILSVKFGEGYSQDMPDGLNHMPRKWALRFDNRLSAEADQIEGFLREHGGYLAFDWTPLHGAPGRWKCKAWKVERPRALVRSISATFEEVFGQ